ncbi:MAG: PHP domain-containing protein [Candidatus Lokiarchaeota archaeon]|nr:PHP domain-containing protein [Candidatus Lokiarchaeota archaeon]
MIDYHIHSDYSDGDQSLKEIRSTAIRRNLTSIAITDHITSEGKFMYLRHTKPPRPFIEYIKNIKKISMDSKIKIYAGVEISDFLPPNAPILKDFSKVDLILIETQKPRGINPKSFDPFQRAVFIKNQFTDIPVGLAHPTIDFIEKNIKKFTKNEIFLELNGDKISRYNSNIDRTFNRLKRIISHHPKLKLSIGSDAHQIYMIGGVKQIWNFVLYNDFLDRLILYP